MLFLQILLFISTGLLCHGAGDSARPPNLLLFLADDMTFTDLGCYGNPDVRTPRLDRLASEGIRFTRFYSSAPTCSPLRQSLFTGLYPVRNGAHPNHSRVYDGIKSIPHHLRPLGYRVGIVGKRHEAPPPHFHLRCLEVRMEIPGNRQMVKTYHWIRRESSWPVILHSHGVCL